MSEPECRQCGCPPPTLQRYACALCGYPTPEADDNASQHPQYPVDPEVRVRLRAAVQQRRKRWSIIAAQARGRLLENVRR
jgi:hypothetical protein